MAAQVHIGRWITYIGLIFLVISYLPVSFAKPPLNLNDEKRAIIEYYHSKAFDKDVLAVIQMDEKYLYKRVVQNKHLAKPHKLAMVLDIDDTCLTNFYAFKKRDFSNLPLEITEGYRHTNLPAIKPVLDLYKKAIQYGVHVFFISFRPYSYFETTRQNLNQAGYRHWDQLYLPNQKELKMEPSVFKTNLRKQIIDRGYTIVLNIGDQESDLKGGYAELTSKIPNPLYNTSANMKESKEYQN